MMFTSGAKAQILSAETAGINACSTRERKAVSQDERFAHSVCSLIKSQVPLSALHLLYERSSLIEHQ